MKTCCSSIIIPAAHVHQGLQVAVKRHAYMPPQSVPASHELSLLQNAVEVRNSVCHSAIIFANAIMHSGTTVDTFLRENLDWLSRATNWAKFSATAGLGVIHR